MRKWLCLFIGVVIVANCKGDSYSQINQALIAKHSVLTGLQKLMVRHIAKKNGFDVKGWVDLSKKVKDVQKDIKLVRQDQKVICTEGNKVSSVTLVREQYITSIDTKAQFLLYFQYHDLDGESVSLNPVPIIRENYVSGADGKNVLFPNGFKGYIVCVEAGEEAYLVSDKINSVEFVDPEWEVNVDIQMFRNPLVPYGRMYKIIVLDNVDVLKNGEKSFFWHMPLADITDIYEFHVIMERMMKGKSCKVLRTMRNGSLVLQCDKMNMSVTTDILNTYGTIGLAVANGLALTSPLLMPSLVNYEIRGYKSYEPYFGGPAEVIVGIPRPFKKSYLRRKEHPVGNYLKRVTDRWLIGNSIVLSLWLAAHIILNGTYYKTVKKNMKKMDQNFDKAPFVFPWRLGYFSEQTM